MHDEFEKVSSLTWLWIGGLSFLSGIASFLQRYQQGLPIKHPLVDFFYDTVYSLLGGFITFSLCMANGLDMWWTVGIVSVGSHQGARLLYQLHLILHSVIRSMAKSVVASTEDEK